MDTPPLTQIERRLLQEIQREFPLAERPWQTLAALLGTSEEECLCIARELYERRLVRTISALFDRAALGYHGTLAAFSVTPGNLASAAEVVNAHPGVTHNYERESRFNLWFTLIVPNRGRLDRTLSQLAREARAEALLNLPALRLFKLRVNLPLAEDSNLGPMDEPLPERRGKPQPGSLTQFERRCVRALQKDFPLVLEPYAVLGALQGIPAVELIEKAKGFLAEGFLRRVGGVLQHRAVGYTANPMVVWEVPEEDVEKTGRLFASFPAVSHCYERAPAERWPFRLYTMIHGRSREECEALVDEMARAAGTAKPDLLYSIREFKKGRLEYFSPAFEEWERKHLG